MADRVDAGVEAMQAPCTQASPYGSWFEPELEQLIPSHHPVLAPRQLDDRLLSFASPRQCPYIGLSRGLGGHGL
jgi:hypothetical protein